MAEKTVTVDFPEHLWAFVCDYRQTTIEYAAVILPSISIKRFCIVIVIVFLFL